MKKAIILATSIFASFAIFGDDTQLGASAMYGATYHNGNTAVGELSMANGASLYGNTAIGKNVMNSGFYLNGNIALGDNALSGAAYCYNNVAIGNNELNGARYLYGTTSINKYQFFATTCDGGLFAINPLQATNITESVMWWRDGVLHINGSISAGNASGSGDMFDSYKRTLTRSVLKSTETMSCEVNTSISGASQEKMEATPLIEISFTHALTAVETPPQFTDCHLSVKVVQKWKYLAGGTWYDYSVNTNSFLESYGIPLVNQSAYEQVSYAEDTKKWYYDSTDPDRYNMMIFTLQLNESNMTFYFTQETHGGETRWDSTNFTECQWPVASEVSDGKKFANTKLLYENGVMNVYVNGYKIGTLNVQ